ncbi:unnamed protein product [Auanema sp. JU1783]|nr:unnamed protein product [Auanema sp. JU1783]
MEMDEETKRNCFQSKSPYVEKFLTYEISNGRDQRYLDLLWRWYEKSGNYDKAATLLSRLADSTRPEVSLSQRFSYLSHAIMCAEASNDEKTRACLEDLRDKVEVARIQISIRDCLKGLSNPSPAQREAIRTLDGPILPLQDLLFNFAVPLDLFKIQLSIYHCGRLYHEDTIMDLWEKILDSELNINDDPAERLRCSLKELHSIFNRTKYFPTEWIVRRLLAKGATSRTIDPSFYFDLIKDVSMSSNQFLNLLLDEYRNGDPFWSKDEFGQKYIVKVGICHAEALLENPNDLKRKAELVGSCEALLSAFSLDSRLVSATPSLRQLSSPLSVLLHRLNGLR